MRDACATRFIAESLCSSETSFSPALVADAERVTWHAHFALPESLLIHHLQRSPVPAEDTAEEAVLLYHLGTLTFGEGMLKELELFL